jgi:hypothetical protein
MTATLPRKSTRRDKPMAGRCPECGRPTSAFAVTGGGPVFPRSAHSADGWRCLDHARTDAERRKATRAMLRQAEQLTLPFCGVVSS